MSSRSNGLICSICLKRLRCCRLGKPDVCSHIFCYTCIFEWAKNVNTCPVDRLKFNTIEVFAVLGGECIEKMFVPDQTMDDEPQDSTYCEVCNDSSREHELLLCDGCDKGYHLDCLTPRLTEVPEGDWYCPLCVPIINAQYSEPLELSDSDSDTRKDWETSSESDSDINKSKKRPNIQNQGRCGTPRAMIRESDSESESDSDVDEMKRRRRIENVCSIGDRALIIESEDDSELSHENSIIECINDHSITKKEKTLASYQQVNDVSSSLPSVSGTLNFSQVEDISDTESIASGYCSSDVEQTKSCSKMVAADSSTDKGSAQSFIGLLRDVAEPSFPTSSLQQPHGVEPTNSDRKGKGKLGGSQKNLADSTSHRNIEKENMLANSSAVGTEIHHQSGPLSSSRSQPRMPRKRKRRRRKRRRKKIVLRQRSQPTRRKEVRPDGSYHPPMPVTMNNRDAIFTRGKARTVASYTPQRHAIREAVKESYRHSSTNAGLEIARKIILAQTKQGYNPYHSPIPSGDPLRCGTPLSGYCTPDSDSRTHRIHPTHSRKDTPLCEYSLPVTDPEREHRVVSEISRRTVPNRKLLTMFHNPGKMAPFRGDSSTGGSSAGGLLDKICQNLDDLNNTQNVIKRDGSIIPMREEDEVHPSQSRSSYVSLLANYAAEESDALNNSSQGAHTNGDCRQSPAGVPLSDGCVESDVTEPELVIDIDGVDDTTSCDQSNDSQTEHVTGTISRTHTQKTSGPPEKYNTSVLHTQMKPVVSVSKVSVKNKLQDNKDMNTKLAQRNVMSCNGHSECVTPSEEPSSSTDSLNVLVDANSLAIVEQFVKTTLNEYHSKGHISAHQYKRIFERAVNKVKVGRTTTLERVKKLVSDFVDLYRLSTS